MTATDYARIITIVYSDKKFPTEAQLEALAKLAARVKRGK